MRAKRPSQRYKYDAALSFAGEDRQHAEALFNQLTQRGFSVFYDANQQAHLWGKTPKAFENIYGPQARYVIPFVSKDYVQKDWTLYEFETAKREQQKRRGEFILPVRLDDSRLLGLHDQVIRLDARRTSIEQIAQFFADKCRPRRRQTPPQAGVNARVMALSLLSQEARRALGLIATAAVPLPRAYFEKLFPEYRWRKLVTTFCRAGLMESESGLLQLNKNALAVLKDDAEQRALRQCWIDRLTPLAAHIDAAAFLSLNLLAAGRPEDAARVAVYIAQYPHLGRWEQMYLSLLNGLARRRHFAKLSREMQIETLNSLGTSLAQAGRYPEALRKFAQLRRLSKASKNAWGIGQSLINAGVAAHNSGDDSAAERLYLQAVVHAKRSRDKMLLGRALSNLSQIYHCRDIDHAQKLLDESIKAKSGAGDSVGLVGSLIVRGNLAVARRDYSSAARCYQEASRAAARLGLRHEQALSTYNYGRALQDLKRMRSAMRAYERARKLAAPDDYTDVLLLSLNALGAIAFHRRQYREARNAARDLLSVARRTKQQEYELGALHLAAVSSRATKRLDSAKEFRAAVKAARSSNADEWLARCLIDSTRQATSEGVGNPSVGKLRGIARKEAAAGKHWVAGKVWVIIAELSAGGANEDATSDAHREAIKHFAQANDSENARMELCRNWFSWAWHVRRYDEALKVLSDLEALARASGRKSAAIAAMDQRAVCMQELGKYVEGEALHRAAAAEARDLGDDEQQERSLNNLGEALRNLDRDGEAIQVFHEAEKIARAAKRLESEISTAHNRALVLERMGKHAASARVLRRCRDVAACHHFWREYARAWEGLANLAWTVGKPKAALQMYRRAEREARRHRIIDIQPRIALNLARLLRAERKTKAALSALAPFRKSFEIFVDAHQYFGTLADLYDRAGMNREAAEAWRDARVRATSLGDLEYASFCTSQEARTLAKPGKAPLSEATLRCALAIEKDPNRRANLLIQMLELSLRKKSARAAQATLDEAVKLCEQYKLREQTVQLHLLVGDHDLAEAKYEEKLNAFKAYVVALMNSIEADPGEMGAVASHIIFKLAAADSPLTEASIKSLVSDLREYIMARAPNADQIVRLLLWPFRMAEQLFPLRKQPRRFLARAESIGSAKGIEGYLNNGGTSSARRN